MRNYFKKGGIKMVKRRDYILSIAGDSEGEAYYGTLTEAKQACKQVYKKEMQAGRLIKIKTKEGELISEYYEKEGWIDFYNKIVSKNKKE